MYNFISLVIWACCALILIDLTAGAAPQNNDNITTEQLQDIVLNHSTVLVYEDGEVLLTLCNPKNGSDCVQAYLNVHDCDHYGSCLFYHVD